jgi:hypothetical protein
MVICKRFDVDEHLPVTMKRRNETETSIVFPLC